MSDLLAFIEARLKDDEAAATNGGSLAGDSWYAHEPMPNPNHWEVLQPGGELCRTTRYAAQHIARHDPARVLREVAAKRAILAEHHRVSRWGSPVDVCDAHDGYTMETVICDTMLALASVWSDHPDYQQGWVAD